jgi:hypothetical protein
MRSTTGFAFAGMSGSTNSRLVFERERDTGAEGGDLPVLDLHVHLGHFGDAQIAQRAGGRFNAMRPASSQDFSLTPTTSMIRYTLSECFFAMGSILSRLN